VPVYEPNTETPRLDPSGKPMYIDVQVSFDEAQLKRVAQIASGHFYRAADTKSMQDIFSEIDKLEKTTVQYKKTQEYTRSLPVVPEGGPGAGEPRDGAGADGLEEAAMTFGAPQWFEGFLLAAACWRRSSCAMRCCGTPAEEAGGGAAAAGLAASTSAARRRWKYALGVLGLAFVTLALTEPRVGYEVIVKPPAGAGFDDRRGYVPEHALDGRAAGPALAGEVRGAGFDRLAERGSGGADRVRRNVVRRGAADGRLLGGGEFADGAGYEIRSRAGERTSPRRSGRRRMRLGKGESTHRALVLFTDGEELEDDAVKAAKEVKRAVQDIYRGSGNAGRIADPAARRRTGERIS
jgi:hypothetical protein